MLIFTFSSLLYLGTLCLDAMILVKSVRFTDFPVEMMAKFNAGRSTLTHLGELREGKIVGDYDRHHTPNMMSPYSRHLTMLT
jgi:hypothetical protein